MLRKITDICTAIVWQILIDVISSNVTAVAVVTRMLSEN